MNEKRFVSMKDTRKTMELLKLSQRSLEELKLMRSKNLSSVVDPFKNIIPTFDYLTTMDITQDVKETTSKTNSLKDRPSKRKKEHEAFPKLRFDKGNTTTEDLKHKTLKKSTLGFKKDDKNKEPPKVEVKKEKEIVYVSCYDDLPFIFKKDVENAKIPIESIEYNLFSLLNILHFCYHGVIFVYREGDTERRTQSQKKYVPFDVQSKEGELLSTTSVKDLFKLGPQLGKGGFGTVFEAKPKKKQQQERLAIKVMPHTTPQQKKYNLREVEYLKKYKHTNIVNLQGAYTMGDELWIVMEHLRGGTLTEARNSHRFNEAQIGYISKHLLIAIQFLHKNGLIHRDIKSQNVMMAIDGTIKLIDFGLCHDTKVFGNVIEMVGSPYWMAPEMIKGETHSFVADIWSFAICILELANNEAPNRDNKLKAMYTVSTIGIPNPLSKPERWSTNFKLFINLCLKTNPSERASASDLLVHPFFNQVASVSVMTEIFSSIFITKALNTFL